MKLLIEFNNQNLKEKLVQALEISEDKKTIRVGDASAIKNDNGEWELKGINRSETLRFDGSFDEALIVGNVLAQSYIETLYQKPAALFKELDAQNIEYTIEPKHS